MLGLKCVMRCNIVMVAVGSTVPGGSMTGNNKIGATFTFSPITTSKIRVLTNASADGVSRVTEIEAYGPMEASGSGGLQWLMGDHLGTPRMVLDETGTLTNVKRHDYLPFGEELVAPKASATSAMGTPMAPKSGSSSPPRNATMKRDSITSVRDIIRQYKDASRASTQVTTRPG